MNWRDHLLACVAEEGAEVAQRATKALRFGLGETQPGHDRDNAERLLAELDDVVTVAAMLAEAGFIARPPEFSAVKRLAVLHYFEYACSIGAGEGR